MKGRGKSLVIPKSYKNARVQQAVPIPSRNEPLGQIESGRASLRTAHRDPAMQTRLLTAGCLVSLLLAGNLAQGAEPDRTAIEFFEKKIRPVLVENCSQCHGAAKQKGMLRLDSRAALLKGGETGPAVVPGDPARSLI